MVDQRFITAFRTAQGHLASGEDELAGALLESLVSVPGLGPLAHYRLGEIFNRSGEVERALVHHRSALASNAALASGITAEGHPHHGYVYESVDEVPIEQCPVCARPGTLVSVYNSLTNEDFIPGFHPLKRWMSCGDCQHLYAASYPRALTDILTSTAPPVHMAPDTRFFPFIGQSVSRLLEQTHHRTLLDVGVGAGDFAAVASEMGFAVEGLDIRAGYAEAVNRSFGLPVHVADFLTFQPGRRYGILVMGDIIEHFANPRPILEKAAGLLDRGGLLYLSTPNFQSAFTKTLGDADPMWRVCEHLGYFSRASAERLLGECGFAIDRYDVSFRYNGSMELTCRLMD